MAVIEIRIYTIHEGRRDEFVRLCDEHVIRAQREHGLDVLGQFTAVDDDHTFVWIRRFESAAERDRQLGEFYATDLWKELSTTAAPFVKDASNVLTVVPTPGSVLQ